MQKDKEDQAPHIGLHKYAPKFMKDNQKITAGYRINFNSPWKILKSLFMIHNESVNIWSHLIAGIIILFIIGYFVISGPTTITHHYSNLRSGITQYINILNNLSISQFQNATSEFYEFQTIIGDKMNNISQLMQVQLSNTILQLDQLNQELQKNYLPNFIHMLDQKLNSTYMTSVKSMLNEYKTIIDSEQFQYLEILKQNSPNPHQVSRWPLIVFLSSAAICLFCSATFHLFYPMSHKFYALFSRFDYAGITILIAGSGFPGIYYGLYCRFHIAMLYLVCCSTGSIFLFIVSVFKWIHLPRNRNYKAFMYGGFGISMGIPVIHVTIDELLFNNYGDKFQFSSSLPYYFLLGASYLFGLYIYTIRCPQRYYPGKFNLCGQSHQIWHFMVIFGIIFTYIGALQNFQMRKQNMCPL